MIQNGKFGEKLNQNIPFSGSFLLLISVFENFPIYGGGELFVNCLLLVFASICLHKNLSIPWKKLLGGWFLKFFSVKRQQQKIVESP